MPDVCLSDSVSAPSEPQLQVTADQTPLPAANFVDIDGCAPKLVCLQTAACPMVYAAP